MAAKLEKIFDLLITMKKLQRSLKNLWEEFYRDLEISFKIFKDFETFSKNFNFFLKVSTCEALNNLKFY